MQLQQQQTSKGGGGPYDNRGTAAAATTPRENERSTATVSQSQLQSLAAALREFRMHRSRSSSYAEDEDVKRTETKRQSRYTNSHVPDHEAVLECDGQAFRRLNAANATALSLESSGSSRHHGHFEQLPFGSRDQAKAKAESSSTSPWDHNRDRAYADSDTAPPPPPLPFVFVKGTLRCMSRSHPLKRQNIFSKGINLNDLQPPQPKRMSQGTQSSESDPFASLQRLASRPSNHGRSAEDAATSQLRKICMDIVQSAEQGTPPPPRAQIKKVVAEYHLSRNNPISPRDPNFTEIPPEFSQVLTYGIARSQTVRQSTVDPNNRFTRRSRSSFSESYATKKILED